MNRLRDLWNPAGAAILLLMLTAASPALADDEASIDPGDQAPAEIAQASKEQARLANEEAVQKAVEAVMHDARLDLDIRLIGRTSVLIAGES